MAGPGKNENKFNMLLLLLGGSHGNLDLTMGAGH